MHYHIILTELCNKQCRYCYEKSMKLAEFDNLDSCKLEIDEKTPVKSEVNVNKLDKFLKTGDTLIFYGGEPLLEIEKIKEIIDKIGNKVKYRMQTNGMLLNEIPIEYLKKIDKILVSIDGTKERTDFNRGNGTYDKVIENINKIRYNGYSGEIVARMTISQDSPDIYEQVLHLVSLVDRGVFNSIHWQIDAGFYRSDFDEKKFSRFVEEYNKSISKLIEWWINNLKKKRFYLLYPFVGIAQSIAKNEKTLMRCGAGHSGFAITTNGRIGACPVTNGIKTFYAGSIDKEKIKEMNVKRDCLKCSYLDLCGGRCLYQNYAQLWPKEGNELICKTVKHLIDELKRYKKDYEKENLSYEKYFGPEIIP